MAGQFIGFRVRRGEGIEDAREREGNGKFNHDTNYGLDADSGLEFDTLDDALAGVCRKVERYDGDGVIEYGGEIVATVTGSIPLHEWSSPTFEKGA